MKEKKIYALCFSALAFFSCGESYNLPINMESQEDGGTIPDMDLSEEPAEDTISPGNPEHCSLMADGVTYICPRVFKRLGGILVPIEAPSEEPVFTYFYHPATNTYLGRVDLEGRVGYGYVPWEGGGVYTLDLTMSEIPDFMLQLIVQSACREVSLGQIQTGLYVIGAGVLVIGTVCTACALVPEFGCTLPATFCLVGDTITGAIIGWSSLALDGLLAIFYPESTVQVCDFLDETFVVPDELIRRNAPPQADELHCNHTSAMVGEEVCCGLLGLTDDYSSAEDMTAIFSATRVGGGMGGFSTEAPALGTTCFSIMNTGVYNLEERCFDTGTPGLNICRNESPFINLTEIVWFDEFKEQSSFEATLTVTPCYPSWTCAPWSTCSCSGTKTRTCNDAHHCPGEPDKPTEIEVCTTCGNGLCDCGENYHTCPEDGCPCIPDWSCTPWSSCSCSNVQTRTCTDSNACGTMTGKPSESQTCSHCGNGVCDCGETHTACSTDCPCSSDCTAISERRCSGSATYQICSLGMDGCLHWSTAVSCASGYICTGAGTCVCSPTPHASYQCYDNDIYWYDSCGGLEAKKDECGAYGCVSGSTTCTVPTCIELCADRECGRVSDCNCGTCPSHETCDTSGLCQPRCVSTITQTSSSWTDWPSGCDDWLLGLTVNTTSGSLHCMEISTTAQSVGTSASDVNLPNGSYTVNVNHSCCLSRTDTIIAVFACECSGTAYIYSHYTDLLNGTYDTSKIIFYRKATHSCSDMP